MINLKEWREWEDNIKAYIKDTERDKLAWIDLAQDWGKWGVGLL
jgi:hypothetical protein